MSKSLGHDIITEVLDRETRRSGEQDSTTLPGPQFSVRREDEIYDSIKDELKPSAFFGYIEIDLEPVENSVYSLEKEGNEVEVYYGGNWLEVYGEKEQIEEYFEDLDISGRLS